MIRKLLQLKSLLVNAGAVFTLALSLVSLSGLVNPGTVYGQQQGESALETGGTGGKCGGEPDQVNTIIDIGCRGRGNPIVDMLFAVIRVLSIGVGIVVIGSVIFAGIQYVTSAGDPQNTAKAIERIRNTVIALALYVLAYALLNWLIPAGLLNQ